MKKLAIVLTGVVFSLVFLFGISYAAEKMAYVDLSRLFTEYSKTKDFEKILDDKQKVYESEREKKVNEVKQMQDKMELLSDKEKEAKKTEFENKLKDLQEFDRLKQGDLRKEGFEKEKEVLKDIEDAVKQYAEKEGYTLVFNDRVLIYQAKNLDISDKIVEILNKTVKK